MDYVVVSLGGSILVPGENDGKRILEIAQLMRSLSKEYRLVLVCGGGKVARYYISTARELGASREQQDELGIEVTRMNAKLLQLALGQDAFGSIPRSVEEAVREARKGNILVMGGTVPGHTTDAVSALVAEGLKAKRIVNATSVDAAYSSDPKSNKEAVRFERLTHQQLFELVDKGSHSAGPSDIFDRKGAESALRSRIPIYIVNGRDLEELKAAIRGEKIKGTVVGD